SRVDPRRLARHLRAELGDVGRRERVERSVAGQRRVPEGGRCEELRARRGRRPCGRGCRGGGRGPGRVGRGDGAPDDGPAAALGGLAAQQPTPAGEVVVVDDASTDATAATARDAGARVVRLERAGGPAAARNAGVAATSAPLLAFTDADCEPAPGWLAALAATL